MKIYSKLNKFIKRSNGFPIILENNEYYFCCKKKYTSLEIKKWEIKNFELPEEYKDFLTNIGACKLYFDKADVGIEFHLLEKISDFTKEVYKGLNNPFPKLFLIASNLNNGDVIGYNSTIKGTGKLNIYSVAEEYPENWLNNTDFISLEIFLEKLILSNGEDYYK